MLDLKTGLGRIPAGYEWWRPEGRSGWVAGDWLRYVDDSATPSPAAAATPTPPAVE